MTNAMSDAFMPFELCLRTPNRPKYTACYVFLVTLPFNGTVDTNELPCTHTCIILIPYAFILFSEAMENHWTLEEMLLTLCRSITICVSVKPHKGQKHHKTTHMLFYKNCQHH